MTENEMIALQDVADGAVLFHNGLWGGPMGFRWADYSGAAAGELAGWEADAVLSLVRRGLVVIESLSVAGRDARVVVTAAGAMLVDRSLLTLAAA
ncbi:hypothetical protein V5P93_003650 [Actinokineospora auranticolor]|uniref:Uncharacterized protein n=1 Tax=Actinokineospora auranticolor TaxID=155976 RepID=A0A2S6GJ45_9PSEU|nr:hypothetical protein [Actinokineospora auranticolor]PPK65213.1 hypothetical protein CLV40_11560 [Actinokineospora auranticolor]